MRKVFLEQNLGKKSKCRFPKRNQKINKIKLTIKAQQAVSTPALTQPLVIAGVSVLEFCENFNVSTQNFEPGLPIRALVSVNSLKKTYELELYTPSVYQLGTRVFTTNSRLNKNYVLAQFIYNLSLIKLTTIDKYYLKNLICFLKQIAGTFRCYDNRLTRINKKKIGNISTIN